MVTVCSESRALRWGNNVCKLNEQSGLWDTTLCSFLVVHASMTSYCKSLMSFVQAYHLQVKEAFPNPNSKDPVHYSPEPDNGNLEASAEEDSP